MNNLYGKKQRILSEQREHFLAEHDSAGVDVCDHLIQTDIELKTVELERDILELNYKKGMTTINDMAKSIHHLNNVSLDLNELISAVTELKDHWVGTYLVKAYVSCYKGKKSPIDLQQFNSLDQGNRHLFICILNMRSSPLWSCDQLYQAELRLKKIVGVK